MAQPEFVPILPQDRGRVGERIPAVRAWPARERVVPVRGAVGPDPGYALRLARRFPLVLSPHEHDDQVIAGCVAVALRRAARYGRAPVGHDLELAFRLFGLLSQASEDIVTWRRSLFEAGSAAVSAVVPDDLLTKAPADVSPELIRPR